MDTTAQHARVAIVGGAGNIARRLIPLLQDKGIEAVPLARRQEQLDELAAMGASPRMLDIEASTTEDFVAAFEGCDAVVFSAGGGGDGNVERKRTVDLEGSLKSAEAARALGIDRFIQVSAIGVDKPADTSRGDAWTAYVAAKRDADASLRESSLAWTILRPGRLTDDEPTGQMQLASEVEPGSIPRADVAAVIVACLENAATVGYQWELVSGDVPIADALARRAR
ncbi:SDR family oxidoreductase [Demequina zhanjiangensis]|uniref:SDR family oxidoreductase n=1 Tax=Demequina zhanjiangensis TaxID=3051659 RepID=A0ABT8G564_9MICO|nr:SDR family oxidoreductase [Demequina sp. SYSU T00b26]MDN4473854.1 SDR family oxidoreductase [Demequina sp. SYSU T00b26]